MNRIVTILAAASLYCLFSCSDNPSNSPGDSNKDSESQVFQCRDADQLLGSPYQTSDSCIDTEQAEVVACKGAENASLADWYRCLQRKSDSSQFWFYGPEDALFDATKWERCASPPANRPTACAVKSCEVAPSTLCAAELTREKYNCGGDTSEWDEHCCARKPCESSDDCETGQECKQIGTIAATDCWRINESSCDCAGTLGGIQKKLCF